MKRKLKLIINGMLPNLNDYTTANRTNRYAGAGMKEVAETRITYAIRQQLKGEKTIERAFITFIWYEQNMRRDPDNIAFAKKFILDALKREKIIRNDGWKCIAGFQDDFFIDKHAERIEVYIDEIDATEPREKTVEKYRLITDDYRKK